MLKAISIIGFAFSISCGLLFWAKQPDPYTRIETTIGKSKNAGFPAIILKPRQKKPWPALVYLHEKRGDGLADGHILRSLARVGFVVVDLSFSRTDPIICKQQFFNAIDMVDNCELVKKESLSWLAKGITQDFFIQLSSYNPDKHPDFLICVPEEQPKYIPFNSAKKASPHFDFPVIFLQKTNETNSLHEEELVNWLREGGNKISFVMYRKSEFLQEALFYQLIAERIQQYLLKVGKLSALGPLPRQPDEAVWRFFWPAGCFCLMGIIFSVRSTIVSLMRNGQLGKLVFFLACSIGIGTGAVLEECLHNKSGIKLCEGNSENERILTFLNKWNLTTIKQREVKDYLALADYNRLVVDWTVAETNYSEEVLCPILKVGVKCDLVWRWKLWSAFYPKIRKSTSPLQAASILVENLREEVQIKEGPPVEFDFMRIWNSRTANPEGFTLLYVASLRSIGIAARIDSKGFVELMDNGKWCCAPRAPHLIP